MNAKFKYLVLIVFILSGTFPARADFTGPPMEAIVAVWIAGLVGGFFACAFVAWIFKGIVEEFTKSKRRHIWFQTILMYLFLAFFLYLEDARYILSDYEDQNRTNYYWTFFFLSIALGCILGYRITPKRKDNRKPGNKLPMEHSSRYSYKLRPGYGSNELLIEMDSKDQADLQFDQILIPLLEQNGFKPGELKDPWQNFIFHSSQGTVSISWDLSNFFIIGEDGNQADILKIDQILSGNPLFEKINVNYSDYK